MSRIADVFKDLDAAIKSNPDQAKRINGVYQWVIDGKDYIMDTKAMCAGEGKAPKPDVTLTISEKDFVDLMTGHANGQQLFMSGKIKFKGSMPLVMKLGELQKIQK